MSTYHRSIPSLKDLSVSLQNQTTVSDRIADVIRRTIVDGQLEPGDRVVESRIARDLGVGQPTVREALVLLEHEGLVVRRANQGCFVTALTNDEIAHALELRHELETYAVRLACANVTPEGLAALHGVTDKMEECARKNDIEAIFRHDLQFHRMLWNLTGNSFLPRLLSQIMLPLLAFLFIRKTRGASLPEMLAQAQEHRQIVDALASGDATHAAAVASEKFRSFADHYLSLIA